MIYNTLPVAPQGAADLERPAGGDRRPLAGMFRVRVVPGNCYRDVLHDGIRSCSGTLGVSFGMQTILRGMRGANFNALGAILEPLGVHLGGVRGGGLGGLGAPLGGSGAVLGPSWPLLSPSSRFWLALGPLLAALGSLLVALGPLLAALGPL